MTDDAKAEAERVLRIGLAQEAGRAVGPAALRTLPALAIVFLYGTINFVIGVNTRRPIDTYIPALGALLSLVGIFTYMMTMSFGRSWLGMVLALAGFVPYVFALFIMIVLGGGRLYALFSEFSVPGLLGGVFWVGVGYWLLYRFWIYTEVVSSVEKARKAVLARHASLMGTDTQRPN